MPISSKQSYAMLESWQKCIAVLVCTPSVTTPVGAVKWRHILSTINQIWLCNFPKLIQFLFSAPMKGMILYARGGRSTFPRCLFCSHVPDRLYSVLPFLEVDLAEISFSIRRFVCAAMARPRCFFDITIGGKPTGRIVFEVSTLSFDCRAYDSCTHSTLFLRLVFSLYLFAYVLYLCCQLILSFVINSSEEM